jgi:hypothetical protein
MPPPLLLGAGWRPTAARSDVSSGPSTEQTAEPSCCAPWIQTESWWVKSELYIQALAEAAADDDDFGPCPSAAIALLWWYY